ncbi:MAG: ECF transporter S component [Nitrososphaerota archaeon]
MSSEISTIKKIVGLASFSVISGLVFAFVSHVIAPLVFIVGGHLGVATIYGLWFIGGTLPAYIMRVRGAAFFGETIASLVELLLVSPYSILLYYYGPAQGVMSEIVFWFRRYKSWGWSTMIVAGMLPVLAAYPFDCLVSPFYPACRDPGYPPLLHAAIIITMLISGALFSGILVKFVVDRLVKAGALRGWPVAKASENKSKER